MSGGATGGHVSAALAVAEAFRERYPASEVLLVGRQRGVEEQMVRDTEFALRTIDVSGWNRDALLANTRLRLLPSALRHGMRVFDEFRPDVVLGVGAYAMVPALWAALRRGVPYVLQVSEPDGLANQMLRSGAAAACVSFPSDVARFPTRRTLYTGYPIRRRFTSHTPAVPPRRLLVMGGSLGARRLNRAVWQALDGLLERYAEVVHLTGAQGAAEAAMHRRDRYRPISTTADVPGLMHEADLIVCRAGLGTCAELTAVGLPAVLVPGTFAGRHQEHNAAELVRAGAAVRIGDRELAANRLLAELDSLDPHRLATMARASAAMGRFDAADAIARVVGETALGVRSTSRSALAASMSLASGALGRIAGLNRSSAAVDRGVQELLGQSAQAAELLTDLAQHEQAEVVSDVERVPGSPGRAGEVSALERELGFDDRQAGEVVPVPVLAADRPGLPDHAVDVPA